MIKWVCGCEGSKVNLATLLHLLKPRLFHCWKRAMAAQQQQEDGEPAWTDCLGQRDAAELDNALFFDYEFSVDQLMEIAGLCVAQVATCVIQWQWLWLGSLCSQWPVVTLLPSLLPLPGSCWSVALATMVETALLLLDIYFSL